MTRISEVATLTRSTINGHFSGTDDWFDPVEFLGKRGTRLLPRGVQLTAACATLFPAEGLGSVSTHRRGVWVATNTFAEQMHESMDEVIRAEGSDGLSPAQAPYFSVNLLASRLSRDVQSHGMSTTITTPGTGLADALASAQYALMAGRVDRALVACTEVAGSAGGELPVDGCVSFLLNQDNVTNGMDFVVERGFAVPGSKSPCAPSMLRREQQPDGNRRELVVFTDRSHSDPCLHSVLDLEGESIDANVHPLGDNMLAQGLELARLVESQRDATVFTILKSGQWSRIHINPLGGSRL